MEGRGDVKDDSEITLDLRYLKNTQKALLCTLQVLI